MYVRDVCGTLCRGLMGIDGYVCICMYVCMSAYDVCGTLCRGLMGIDVYVCMYVCLHVMCVGLFAGVCICIHVNLNIYVYLFYS